MKNVNEPQDALQNESSILEVRVERCSFLQYTGAGAVLVALTAAGCRKDRPVVPTTGVTLDFKDDIDVLIILMF